jgi:hypothetical protein
VFTRYTTCTARVTVFCNAAALALPLNAASLPPLPANTLTAAVHCMPTLWLQLCIAGCARCTCGVTAVGRGGVNLRRFCRAAAASSTCYRGVEGEVRGGIMHSGTAAADAHAPSQPLGPMHHNCPLPPITCVRMDAPKCGKFFPPTTTESATEGRGVGRCAGSLAH